MWARTRGGACLVVVLASVFAVAGGAITGGRVGAQGPTEAVVTPPPGSLVLALPALGQVNAVLPDGLMQVLARGLSGPAAVAVLADGTVVVAENTANRISAFGGRFPAEPQPIATVPAPTGLVAGSDGTVFVTAAGEVGRVDLTTRQYQPIAGGFASPIGPALRDTTLYVPDLAAGRVATIDTTTGAELGDVATIAAPGGAAAAPGLPLFVTQTQGPGVVRVDPGGVATPFATVPGALQVTFEPAAPPPDSSWVLVVTTQDGVTRLTPEGQVQGDRLSLPGIAGAVVAPESATASADVSGSGTTTVLKDDASSGSNASLLLIVGLVVLGVLAVVGITVWFARRAGRREREDDDFMPPPPDPAGLAPVFGGCAEQEMEMEVDRLQDLLRLAAGQLDGARTRRRRASEASSAARDRAMRALEVRTSVRNRRLAAEPTPDSERLSWAQLSFATAEGREVFEAYRRREIDVRQLKARFAELGETGVIAQISEEGRKQLRSDPTVPWPEEGAATREAIAARDELRAHEAEAGDAAEEEAQLTSRQQELTAELGAARQRLDDCRQAKP